MRRFFFARDKRRAVLTWSLVIVLHCCKGIVGIRGNALLVLSLHSIICVFVKAELKPCNMRSVAE